MTHRALRSRISFFVGALYAATALARPAIAQQNSTVVETPPDAGKGDEIIVTAQKKESNAQKTPVALTAYGAQTLATNGVYNISSLTRLTPSVSFGENGGGASIITLRGVSGRDTNDTGYSAVAVNIDDVFISRPTGLNASFYDLERVEVLRGPQGTLYGRNATAGVINLITKKPVLGRTEGYVSLSGGNYQTIDADGAVNIPVGDNFAIRGSFESRYHEGYRNNGDGGRGDDENSKGGRLQALYQPTSNLKILVGVSQLHMGGTGSVYDGVPFTYDASGNIATRATTSAYDATHFALNTEGYVNSNDTLLSGRVEYDFGPATATYIGAYHRLKYKQLWDNDGQATRGYTYLRDELNKDQSHELRFASNNIPKLDLASGLYYFKGDASNHNRFDKLNGIDPVNVRAYEGSGTTKNYGIFGQAGYHILNDVTVSGGVRYSKDKVYNYSENWVGSLTQDVSSGTAVRAFSITDNGVSSHKVTWHAGLDWQVDPAHLLYAKVDTGYKGGGTTGIGGLMTYKPETIRAYEIGSKNRFFGNKLQANITGFYYDYTNQQVNQYTVEFGNVTTNAGKSRIYGVELETVLHMTAKDRLDFSGTYLNAKYTKFDVANGSSNLSLSGNRAIQAPKWALNGGYEHVFATSHGEFTFRAQTEFKTAQYFTFYNRGNDRMGAYTRTDLSIEFHPSNTKLTVQGFVRNIENRVVLTNADSSAAVYGATRYQYAAPRTFGGRLRFDW